MKNRYVISIVLNGQDYATFERGELRGELHAWTDDVGDPLPPRIESALTDLESALEAEPTNEASHETGRRPGDRVDFVPADAATAHLVGLLGDQSDRRSWKELIADALRGDASAKAIISAIGDAQDAAATTEELLDRRG